MFANLKGNFKLDLISDIDFAAVQSVFKLSPEMSDSYVYLYERMSGGAKSFGCDQCAFVSNRNDSLKRHKKKYHSAPLLGDESEPQINDSNMNILSLDDPWDRTDGRLQLPNNFIYAGASQSGKTTLLIKTLENASKMYNPVPKRVFIIYSCEQENYPKLKQKLSDQGILCRFIKGNLVNEDDLSEMADPNGGQTLIVIDDNSVKAASSKEMAHVFTIARHKNCSIALLLHFVFGPWPSNRIILSNTSYVFLLKSPRMAQQVATLGSQIGKRDALVTAYARESKKKYGYVLLDLRTTTLDNKRLRTDIFKDIDQSIAEVPPLEERAPKRALIEPEEGPSKKKQKMLNEKPKKRKQRPPGIPAFPSKKRKQENLSEKLKHWVGTVEVLNSCT